MPALTLPLIFNNSFWTQDFRTGLEILYGKLEQGIDENDEIVSFIQARIEAEAAIAEQLINAVPTGQKGRGFNADDGASLLMAFRGLQVESVAQGEKHRDIAKELATLVVAPFNEWAQGHKARIGTSRANVLENWVKHYEIAQGDVEKLRQQYLAKMRKADEAADDVKFAPNNDFGDKYTTSPKLNGRDKPQRSATISDRIAQRFKDIQKKATSAKTPDSPTLVFEAHSPGHEDKPLPSIEKVDKGKGKAVEEPESLEMVASPPSLSPTLPPKLALQEATPPPPIVLAGVTMQPGVVSEMLKRAAAEMPLRNVKFPILGEYVGCFSGEEFAAWLAAKAQEFEGDLDKAEEAARQLTEKEGCLRRIGEFGNKFENTDDAFYQFRPKAFDLTNEQPKAQDSPQSPIIAPIAENLVKRSGTLVNFVSKAITTNMTSEPPYIKARADAEAADQTYRTAVRKLDKQRLGLEERIEDTLKSLQTWETERLRAVKTVLLQYQGTLKNLPTSLQPSLDRSSTLLSAYQPESDLKALIERYRTGPFRPTPHVYESITHDEWDVMFGIDLRKWADGGWNGLRGDDEKKEKIPGVVAALLSALNDMYATLPNDSEKRKVWIYEVPLKAVHHLRESINGVAPGQPISSKMLAAYDAPVLASCLKLWILELDPSLGTWEGWDDIRQLYPVVGGSTKNESESNDQQRLQDLQVALQRLPQVHLLVLDAIVGHLKTLIDTTTVEESKDVYITKLALSIGRLVLRPKVENEMSIQDRHPTLLFIDLVKNYDDILPPTILKKKRESDRRVPIRKRTAPIDLRMKRSRLSVGIDPQEILAAQLAAKNPGMKIPARALSPAPNRTSFIVPASPPVPPTPPVPTSIAGSAEPQSTPFVPPPPPPPPPGAPASTPPTESVVPPVADAPSPTTAGESKPEHDDNTDTPRPMFKEPAPEVDGELPMPKFEEPPASPDLLPMPNFAAPPPEKEQLQVTAAPITVSPPTPQRSSSPSSPASGTQSPTKRPGSPRSQSVERQGDGADLSRSSSGEAARIRGPRSRGPRPQSASGGSNVQSLAAGFNRGPAQPATANTSMGARLNRANPGRPLSVANPADYEPKKKGVGRVQAGAFSRRTMASDAEDEVVDK
ncbi:hypothetical protein BD410DRAFT_856763 [Rickenella mellea]|uniref:Rho-GAP domain-containing protein n=1 Tax=Rickenella mellea TaxID=50990 RepID=A0A4Y7QAD4_9AGAM|nr:hypothetical protein BD410DRAFT_856763 [Rickenella mellea]